MILLWLRDGLAPLIVAHGRYARVRSPHESYANISTGERSMSAPHLPPVELHEEASALRATFVPAAGMLCSSLRHRGEELLAQNAGVAAYAETGKTMGIPLLYPWANRLAGFDYTVAGRSVSVTHDSTRVRLDAAGLPIHGVIGGRLCAVRGDCTVYVTARSGSGAPCWISQSEDSSMMVMTPAFNTSRTLCARSMVIP